MNHSCFFTGHRDLPADQINQIKALLKQHITDLIENYGVTRFITGGAAGFDTLSAYGVLFLRDKYPHIRLDVFIPYPDYCKMLKNEQDLFLYDQVLRLCNEFRYISEHYTKDAMRLRNFEMVNNAQYGIAYLQRYATGSGQTYRYAQRQNRTLWNIAEEINQTSGIKAIPRL